MISLVDITPNNLHEFQDDIMEIERTSFPSPWSLSAFRQEVNCPISHLWALLIDEAFAGYICFWMFSGEIHLMNIAVDPLRRGTGLGSHLLYKMIEAGLSKGMKRAWLEVRPSNLVAKGLYKKVGFREISRRPRYYRDTNEDGIIMSRSLFREEVKGRKISEKANLQSV
jgi:ribosomal-protein-alanine N-acetyltransferase